MSGESLPFVSHSETSREAALAAEPNAATQRGRILAFLRGRLGAGATDEEIQAALDLSGSTERPRRVELVERGFVYEIGETRRTLSGRRATVWRAR